MGYRSKVLFAIDKTEDVTLRLTYPQIIEILNEADTMWEKCFTDCTPYIVYSWDYIKWYESWPPVAALQEWMQKFRDDREEMPFQFARQGEEDTDLEIIGNWSYGLSHDVYHEDDLLTTVAKKALTRVLAMIEDEWGQYMDEDLKRDYELLIPLSNLRQSQEKSDKL